MPTHRERVLAALKGETLDRVPMWYGAAPETTARVAAVLGVEPTEPAVLDALEIDFRTLRPRYVGEPLAEHADGTRDTIWGITRGGAHWGQAVTHPLAKARTVAEVEAYGWPSVDDWDVASLHPLAQRHHVEHAVIGGDWSPFFHDVAELFGMERMFLLMYEAPELVEAAAARAMEFYLESSRRMFEALSDELDVFFIGNDFGGQTGLLCSPVAWRRFFAPGISQMIELGHRYGLAVALHACGSIHAILPDLIEMGLDMINPVQVGARDMSPEALARDFGRDIVFFGGVDVQVLLPRGTVAQVQAEVHRLIDLFTAHGGYVLAPAHDYLLPEIPPENIVAMYRAGAAHLRA